MKTRVLVLFLAITGIGVLGAGEDVSPSPAALRMAAAQKVLQRGPNRYQAENDLAIALIRRARETGDSSYYQQADAAVERSLKIQPLNFEAGQAHAALLLLPNTDTDQRWKRLGRSIIECPTPSWSGGTWQRLRLNWGTTNRRRNRRSG